MTQIAVNTPAGVHDVLIGRLEEWAPQLRASLSDAPCPLIADEHVISLHGGRLTDLGAFQPIPVPSGDAAKSLAVLEQVLGELNRLNHPRSMPIVALGGGSVGDLAGLAASIFKRGCPIVHLPTTLLAMVDSAIGGKTGIDFCGQKNLIGTFHWPKLVVIDPSFLATLDARQLRSGYAETVKYGLIRDRAFFEWCERNGRRVVAGEVDACASAIEHCVRAKSDVIAGDFEDRLGRRALLNFGHSFGHAIEAALGPDAVLHGEAVAIGMALAFRLSVELGLCPAEDAKRTIDHLGAAGLPTSLASLPSPPSSDMLLGLMARDKKADRSGPRLILSRGIGAAFVAEGIEVSRLRSFLERAP